MDRQARSALLQWYRAHRRDLPWRRTSDPYAIWVSEVMLQQTRVDVVAPYFQRWMAAFPTLRHLAHADPEAVQRLWSGLGYYARARNLQEGAQAALAQAGALPATRDALLEVPGIGPYTAGAIASIAYGEPVPAVDGNVVRVACRLLGIADPVQGRARIEQAAASWVDADAPGDWNQALMELGATVCTPRAPRCGACPVSGACAARAQGTAEAIPQPRTRAAPRMEAVRFAAVVDEGRVLLVRNPPGLLGGLWALPGGAVAGARALQEAVAQQAGHEVRLEPRVHRAQHAFSHRVWRMRVQRAAPVAQAGAAARETLWVPADRLAGHPLPTATRVALRAAGFQA